MARVYFLLTGVLEVGWTIGLKYTEGWTKLFPSPPCGGKVRPVLSEAEGMGGG